MDNDLFLQLLKQILEAQQLLHREFKALAIPDRKISAHFELLDNTDVKALLKISNSTLYRIAKNGIINPVRIGGKNYYRRDEIVGLLKHFQK